MNKMIRSLRSTLTKTLVLSAFALSLLVTSAIAFADRESGGAEQQRRRYHHELTFTQIDFPGATFTEANGINNRGQIVGLFGDAGGVFHGFLLEDGAFTQIDFPGAPQTLPNDINDRGQVVGVFGASLLDAHGFLLHDGVFTQIDFPGALATVGLGINDRGQIVGGFIDAGGAQHGFLLDNGVFTQIDVPGSPGTAPFDIDRRGRILGLFGDAGGAEHGFLLDDGVFTQIDVPGGVDTNPLGINDRGQIVGHVGPVGAFHGFLFDEGAFTQIDFPGAPNTIVNGINDRGEIVGNFTDAVGVDHGLLATKERFSGKAIGLGAGADNAAVEIAGTFTSPTDLDLSAATLTISNLLNEQAGGGELVSGTPLVLTAAPESRRNFAVFVDRSRPNITSVTIHDAGPGKFNFKIKVDDATINSLQNCSPTRLTTGFRLDAGNNPPIVVSTERSWDCSGPSNRFLKTH
jgi:probable HAF family extracellular repeat protein